MSLKFQILPGNPQLVSFVNRAGQPGQFFKQQAIVAFADGSQAGVEIVPPKGQQPYAPGLYTLDESTSFYASQGKLQFSPRLIPASK